MRTRQKDRDVPAPGAPWNEILPNLWMGGHYWRDESGELKFAVVENQFDAVVSLFRSPGHGPPEGVEHHIAEMPDEPLNATQIADVQRLATITADTVRAARKTLVRCHAGYNRSGLVVAQALIEMGHNAPDAIALIRQRRSPWALHNKVFEDYLTTGLTVAHLLVDLDG